MKLHEQSVNNFTHQHEAVEVNRSNEISALRVILLTGITMVVEVIAGYLTGSMALLADGWHMGTHVLALGITWGAYQLARHLRGSERFTFGTGKFNVLGGYTSALFLGIAALWMIVESVERLFNPQTIAFSQAIFVVIIGLLVNLASVLIMQHGGHDHHHEHEHAHDDFDCYPSGNQHIENESGHTNAHEHNHEEHDHSFRAAYLHVLADTFTSVLALVALLCGRYLDWAFLDPVMGIVGGLVISKWAYSLLCTTGIILLDGGVSEKLRTKIRSSLEKDEDTKIADLHIWKASAKNVAVVATVISGKGRQPAQYHDRLKGIPDVKHINIEVNPCDDESCNCRAVHNEDS